MILVYINRIIFTFSAFDIKEKATKNILLGEIW